jgi:hypothetical protein
VLNQPQKARDHFRGLQEAKKDLVGFALFDRLDQTLQDRPELREYKWKRREIENYLCQPETLLAYAESSARGIGPLFEPAERDRRVAAIKECVEDLVPRAAQRDPSDRWWMDTKATDEFLDRVFELFFKKLGLPNLMRKTHYHVLAGHVPVGQVDQEVPQVLDLILATARRARPSGGAGQ